MSRVLLTVGLALTLLAFVAGAAAWLAYGTAPTREGTLDVSGLAGPVTLAWSDSGAVTVEAETLTDLAAGLGYAHAAEQAWPMAWLRQSARGTAAEWFGDSLRVRDLHARRLGFDALAQQTYNALPPADRALFDAYATGVNRALREPGVAQSDPFVLLDVSPEPWEPWDAIAVERLIAWVGTDAPGTDSTWAVARAQSPQVALFAHADSVFRAGVGLDGMAHGRVFVAPSAAGPTLVQHHAIGSTAESFFVPVRLRVGERETAALTIPGTLLLPGGATAGQRAWGMLLTSEAQIAPYAGSLPPLVYSRLVERDGDESLIGARRDSTGLVVGKARRTVRASAPRPRPAPRPDTTLPTPATPQPAPPGQPPASLPDTVATAASRPDSVASSPTGRWRIGWAGFGYVSDAPALFRLATGAPMTAMRVFRGTGLAASLREARVLGTPRVVVQTDSLVFVSDAPPARAAVVRLAALARYRPRPASLAADAVSAPAITTLRPLLAALGNRDSLATVLQEPYSFLASWDGGYTADAIGATLYAAWLDAHESVTGRRPDPADSLDRALLPFSLRLARAELRDRHGPHAAGWQWGQFQGGPRYPVLGGRRGAAARAYRLAPTGSGGHPTALRPGPAPDGGGGPAVWTAWVPLNGRRMFVRAPRRRLVTESEVETTDMLRGRTTAVALDGVVASDRLTLLPRR